MNDGQAAAAAAAEAAETAARMFALVGVLLMVALFVLLGVLVFYRRSGDRAAATWSMVDARLAGMMHPAAPRQLEPGWQKLREWAPVVSVMVSLLALAVAGSILVAAQLSRIEDRHRAAIIEVSARVEGLVDGIKDETRFVRVELEGFARKMAEIDTRLAVIEVRLGVPPAAEPPDPLLAEPPAAGPPE